jgi:hypothetical protein
LSVKASNATRQHSANAARNFSSGTLPSLAARMAANASANIPLVGRGEATSKMIALVIGRAARFSSIFTNV